MKHLSSLITFCVIVVLGCSLKADPAQSPKKLSTVLGVNVGMSMKETLTSLQERSKRFHVIPRISADAESLSLLTDIQMSDVRLGWQNNFEMIASGAQVTFYHGKVVRIIVQSDKTIATRKEWDTFFRKMPNTSKKRSSITSDGVMINAIENCAIGSTSDDNVLMILRDEDNWNSYLEEKKNLEEFFRKIPRADEVLD